MNFSRPYFVTAAFTGAYQAASSGSGIVYAASFSPSGSSLSAPPMISVYAAREVFDVPECDAERAGVDRIVRPVIAQLDADGRLDEVVAHHIAQILFGLFHRPTAAAPRSPGCSWR